MGNGENVTTNTGSNPEKRNNSVKSGEYSQGWHKWLNGMK